MIKEYAVEPEFLKMENILPFIHSSFGFENGRVISKFPKKWLKLVYESLSDVADKKKKNIEIGLEYIKKKNYLVSSNRDYNNDINWIDNAIDQQSEKPFHAIICTQENNDRDDVLSLDDLNQGHVLFSGNTSGNVINRDADSIADKIYSIARFAQKLLWIDPYFSDLKDRHIRPLVRLFEILNENDLSIDIEIHISDKDYDADYFLDRLPEFIPNETEINIIVWESEELHNRYILTTNCGALFGTGLDDNISESGIHDDDVNLLSEDQFNKRWSKFNDTEKTKIAIHGKKEVI